MSNLIRIYNLSKYSKKYRTRIKNQKRFNKEISKNYDHLMVVCKKVVDTFLSLFRNNKFTELLQMIKNKEEK